MTNKEENYLYMLLDSIKYISDIFTIAISEDKVILGAITPNECKIQKFFSMATVYDSILDVNNKIQFSLREAIEFAKKSERKKWNPIVSLSDDEWKAIYFMENAVFRIETAWDLLAQLYNIYQGYETDNKKIQAKKFFYDCQKREKSLEFAKRVYNYMLLSDNVDVEPWEGNYIYVKDYRNKMSHRNSPSVNSFSNYDTTIRRPTLYILKRVVEDYHKFSAFIQELVNKIISEYDSMEVIFNKGDNNV